MVNAQTINRPTAGTSSQQLPRRVVVRSVIDSRYEPGTRPVNWDERREGVETVEVEGEGRIRLFSSGGQSSPAPGWELLLTDRSHANPTLGDDPAYVWTLYGIKRQ